MIFLRWIEYPHMMVCVHGTDDGGFTCSKYVGGQKIMGVSRQVKTKEELSTFLLSLPNPPNNYIEEFLSS
jgi:hypothetical protein